MRRLPILLVALLAASLAAALIARAGSGAPNDFRTPDAGAACQVFGSAVVCSSLGSTGSVALRTSGHAYVVGSLPWWDASTPVLHRFRRGSISCRLNGSAILCRNASTAIRVTGNGFAVASS